MSSDGFSLGEDDALYIHRLHAVYVAGWRWIAVASSRCGRNGHLILDAQVLIMRCCICLTGQLARYLPGFHIS
jgi:hypothetical protein